MRSEFETKDVPFLMECTICNVEFDPDLEGGGVVGQIGILPVALCPTCLNGMLDMAEQLCAREDCPNPNENCPRTH